VENDKKINAVDGLSLKVRAGEIFGIAGVDGNGQKELVEAINNLRKSKSGTIKMNGKEIQNTSVLNILNQKISTIPEDRQKRGLVLDFTVAENAALKKYRTPDFSKNGILNKSKILDFSKSLIKNYNINPPNCQNIPCRGLSGGNQQKVIIAREISEEPELLIAVQPTRGLDVGAIEYVHKVLIEQREAGKAVLLISLELDEIMNIADTISVIYNGKIVKTFPQGEVNEETIGLLMAGGNSDAVCCKNA
jgi:simple sugar transport system ATP-binding protein